MGVVRKMGFTPLASLAGGDLRSVSDDLSSSWVVVAFARLFAQRVQEVPGRTDVEIPLGIVEKVLPPELLRFPARLVQRHIRSNALPLYTCNVLGCAILAVPGDVAQEGAT